MTDVRYDHALLVEVLVAHQRRDIEGCRCGWSELGHSHPEHIATEYEGAVREALAGQYSHDGIRKDKLIHPREHHG